MMFFSHLFTLSFINSSFSSTVCSKVNDHIHEHTRSLYIFMVLDHISSRMLVFFMHYLKFVYSEFIEVLGY